MIVDIYPYSFPEYLVAQGKDKNYLEVLSTKDRAEVVGMCDQYVKIRCFYGNWSISETSRNI